MLAICRYGNGFEPEAPLVLPPLEEVTDEIALIVGNVCITMRNDRHDYRSIRRLAAFAQTIVVFFSDNGGCGRYAPQTPRVRSMVETSCLRFAQANRIERRCTGTYPHCHHGEGMRPTGAIRDRKYKLVEWFEDGRVELYNLAVDPGETTNLVKSEPKIAARLLSSFQTWRDRVGVQMPTLR